MRASSKFRTILVLSSLVKEDNSRDSITYNFIIRELEALAARGHKVILITRNVGPQKEIKGVVLQPLPSKITLRANMLKIFVRNLNIFLPGMIIDFHTVVQVLKIEASVEAYLARNRVDVIHTHFLFPRGESGVVASLKHQIPIVATLRGAELQDREDLQYGACRSRIFRFLFNSFKDNITCFTSPNRALRDSLINDFSVGPNRVEFVPNGAKVDLPNCDNKPLSSTKIKAICVGWFIPLKNHMVLLKALAASKNSAYELTLVGDGPLLSDYLQFISENNLEENVRVIKTLPRIELLNKIRNSDVLVQTSIVEGMPNVVLEALSLGVPCVVSNIPGHSDVVVEGYNGFYFETLDSNSLAFTLQRIQGNPNLLRKIAPNCVRAKKIFSLDAKIARYECLYEHLCA